MMPMARASDDLAADSLTQRQRRHAEVRHGVQGGDNKEGVRMFMQTP